MDPIQSEYLQRSRSNSGSVLSSRLRAASKMCQDGVISGDEKAKLKNLILSQNPAFKELYDRAEQSGDWTKVKAILKSGQWNNLKRTLSVDMLNDLAADVGIGDDDFMVFGSVFENPGANGQADRGMSFNAAMPPPLEVPVQPHVKREMGTTYSRKREASQSMPSQDRNKVMPPPRSSIGMPPLAPVPGLVVPPDSSNPIMEGHQMPGPYRHNNPANHLLERSQRAPIKPPQQARRAAPSQAPAQPPKPISKQKVRKNERERKRRLAVSQGFEELYKLLNIPETQKLDKATILRTTIERIQNLEKEVESLELEHGKLLQAKHEKGRMNKTEATNLQPVSNGNQNPQSPRNETTKMPIPESASTL